MTKTATASKTRRTSVTRRAAAIAAAECRKATAEWKAIGIQTLEAELTLAGQACLNAEREFEWAVRRYEQGSQTELERYQMQRSHRQHEAIKAEYFHLMNRINELRKEMSDATRGSAAK